MTPGQESERDEFCPKNAHHFVVCGECAAERERQLEAQIVELREALGLARSMILSREPMSVEAEHVIDAALSTDQPSDLTTSEDVRQNTHSVERSRRERADQPEGE